MVEMRLPLVAPPAKMSSFQGHLAVKIMHNSVEHHLTAWLMPGASKTLLSEVKADEFNLPYAVWEALDEQILKIGGGNIALKGLVIDALEVAGIPNNNYPLSVVPQIPGDVAVDMVIGVDLLPPSVYAAYIDYSTNEYVLVS